MKYGDRVQRAIQRVPHDTNSLTERPVAERRKDVIDWQINASDHEINDRVRHEDLVKDELLSIPSENKEKHEHVSQDSSQTKRNLEYCWCECLLGEIAVAS